jgi:hypothetical protein
MATVTQLGKATVFTVGGTDFNDQLRTITMTKTLPALDATTLASTYVENVAGLENSETTFTLLGNFVLNSRSDPIRIRRRRNYFRLSFTNLSRPLRERARLGIPTPGGYLASAPIVVNVGELVEISCTYSGGEITQAVA